MVTSSLFAACTRGDRSRVQLLLESGGVDINGRGGISNGTALLHCVKSGHADVARLLIQYGCDLNIFDEEGWNPLLIAAFQGKENMVRLLLEAGAKVDVARAVNGYTPLHFALVSANEDIVRLLVEHGAKVNEIAVGSGQTPLKYCQVKMQMEHDPSIAASYELIGRVLRSGNGGLSEQERKKPISPLKKVISEQKSSGDAYIEVRRLLATVPDNELNRGNSTTTSSGVNPFETDHLGNTLLHLAVSKQHCTEEIQTPVVEALIKAGIDVNVVNSERMTAIHFAVQKQWPSIVRMLLNAGADVNVRDCAGDTLVHNIVSSDYFGSKAPEVVEILLSHGADINALNSSGLSALWIAAERKRKPIVSYLIDVGANVNVTYRDGNTILHRAVERGWWDDIIGALITAGADPNIQNSDGRIALHLASMTTSAQLVELLAPHIKDWNVMDNQGNTALHHAATKGRDQLIVLLVKGGAKIDSRNQNMSTPLMMAALFGHEKCVATLLRFRANSTAVDKDGQAPLHYAVLHKTSDNCKVIQILIEKLGNVNQKDDGGKTPVERIVGQLMDPDVVRADSERLGWLIARARVLHRHGASMKLVHEVLRITKGGPSGERFIDFLVKDCGISVSSVNDAGMTPIVQTVDDVGRGTIGTIDGGNMIRVLTEHGADLNEAIKEASSPDRNDKMKSPTSMRKSPGNVTRPGQPSNYSTPTRHILSPQQQHTTPSRTSASVFEDVRRRLLSSPAMIHSTYSASSTSKSFDEDTVLFRMINKHSFVDSQIIDLITLGADVNVPDSCGHSPLYHAVRNRRSDLIRFLIQTKGMDVNRQYDDGTVVHLACGLGFSDIVHLLESLGADMNLKDPAGRTPLHIAATEKGQTVIHAVIRSCMKRDSLDDKLMAPLHLSALKNTDVVANVLLSAGANVNIKDGGGLTPLMVASFCGHDRVVHACLKHGAYVNDVDRGGRSALHWALAYDWCNEAVIRLLLEGGSSVSVQSYDKKSPMDLIIAQLKDPALSSSPPSPRLEFFSKTVTMLARRGADVNVVHKVMEHTHCSPAGEVIAQVLVDCGANPNSKDDEGRTPLQAAVTEMCAARTPRWDCERVVNFLVKNGADVNLACDAMGGDTPLHQVLKAKRIHVADREKFVTFLVRNHSCNINIQNSYGESPLFLSIKAGDQSLASILIDNGADVNLRDESGRSPLEQMIAKLSEPEFSGPKGAQLLKETETMAEVLLDHGAEVNVLHQLITNTKGRAECTDLMKMFVKRGADVDWQDASGLTPLQLVVSLICATTIRRTDGEKLITFLIEQGADVNLQTCTATADAPLHQMLRDNKIGKFDVFQIVQLLVEIHHADVNVTNSADETPLFLAVDRLDEKICRLLVDSGANVSAQDGKSRTPLARAIEGQVIAYKNSTPGDSNHAVALSNNMQSVFSIASLLLDKGAATEKKNKLGETPLLQSTGLTNSKVLKLLVNRGADVNITDNRRRSPFYCIIEELISRPNEQRCSVLEDMAASLVAKGANTDVSIGGRSALDLVVDAADYGLLKLLVETGADINAKNIRTGEQLIHRIVRDAADAIADGASATLVSFWFNSLELLLENGAEKSLTTHVVRCAIRGGVLNISIGERLMSLLLKHNADVNALVDDDHQGCRSTLHYVVDSVLSRTLSFNVALPMVNWLCDNGANKDLCKGYGSGNAPIHDICGPAGVCGDGDMDSTDEQSIFMKMLTLFLERGSDVNGRNSMGETALVVAVRAHRPNAVEALLRSRADPNITTSPALLEFSALHFAVTLGYNDLAFVLLDNGADIDSLASNGCTCLHLLLALPRDQPLNLTLIKRLISRGADVNLIETSQKHSALSLVSTRHALVDICQLLIQQRADVDHIDISSRSMIHNCLLQLVGSEIQPDRRVALGSIIEMMVDAGADVKSNPLLLHSAVLLPSEHLVEVFINAGCDVNVVDSNNKTPLHIVLDQMVTASKPRRDTLESMAKFLTSVTGYNPNVGESLLFQAMEVYSDAITGYLVSSGADINQTRNDVSPLALALSRDQTEAARLLLEAGANPNITYATGETALYAAFKSKKDDVVKMLTMHGADVNCQDDQGRTPFHAIIEELSTSPSEERLDALENMADGFIQRGADANVVDVVIDQTHCNDVGFRFTKFLKNHGAQLSVQSTIRGGLTPIAQVVADTMIDVIPLTDAEPFVALLLDLGADPNVTNATGGTTALHSACEGGLESIVAILLGTNEASLASSSGDRVHAAPNQRTAQGETPLLLATSRGFAHVVKQLVAAGADSSIAAGPSALSLSPLHIAAQRGYPDVLSLLVGGEKVNVNVLGYWCRTPLHMVVVGSADNAMAAGHEKCLDILIKGGANLEIRDADGNTALMLCVKRGYLNGVKTLVNGGACVMTSDYSGGSALSLAITLGRESLIECMLASLKDKMDDVHTVTAAVTRDMSKVLTAIDESGGRLWSMSSENNTWCMASVRSSCWGTRLWTAALIGSIPCLQQCIDANSPLNARDSTGRNLLHWSAIWGTSAHTAIAKLVLNAGVKGDDVDMYGNTAIDLAHRYARSELLTLYGVAARESDDMYMDVTFDACLLSLVGGGDRGSAVWLRYRDVEWSRPSIPSLSKGALSITIDDHSPLTNLWFTSMMAALSNDAINAMFVLEEPSRGHYIIRCGHLGKLIDVEIDDRLPMIGTRFATCGGSGNDIRLPLIEKAYAKINGSYADLRLLSLGGVTGLLTSHVSSSISLAGMTDDRARGEAAHYAASYLSSFMSSPLLVEGGDDDGGVTAVTTMANIFTTTPPSLKQDSCDHRGGGGGPRHSSIIGHNPMLRVRVTASSDVQITYNGGATNEKRTLAIDIYCSEKDRYILAGSEERDVVDGIVSIGVRLDAGDYMIACFTSDGAGRMPATVQVGASDGGVKVEVLAQCGAILN